MKVLHLSESPLSSAPYRLMQVQRTGGIDARLILHTHRYTDNSLIAHPYDVLLQDRHPNTKLRVKPNFNKEEIFSLFNDADVLHFHNYFSDHFIFRLYPALEKLLPSKKVVFQVHSPRTSLGKITSVLKDKRIHERLVVAQYQVRQFPECIPVPNAIPIHDSYHVPIKRNHATLRICHSPSNTVLKGWNDKGTDVTKSAIKRLQNPHEFVQVTNTPHLQCLRIKQGCDIAIDEIMTGSYHMCTLEAMAQGVIPVCNIDSQCEEVLYKLTGSSRTPIVKANKDNLATILDDLLSDVEWLKLRQKECRNFMETYWSTERLCSIFQEIYER